MNTAIDKRDCVDEIVDIERFTEEGRRVPGPLVKATRSA